MQNKRNIIACAMGNIIEWYEFALFAYLAPVIAQLFFPQENHVLGLLSTLLIFSLGFIVRPIGSVVFGHIGDRAGRARALKLTIFLLSISSVITGLLPVYQQAGLWAPILLMACRLLQGLCIGGEFAGTMIYLSESANPKYRALTSCMSNNGSNIGVLIAISACSLLTSEMSSSSFALYGWRLLFILGGMVGLTGLWLRRDISESDVFIALQKRVGQNYFPLTVVFRHHKTTMIKVMLFLFISASGSYTLMNYISTYLHTFLGVPLANAYQLVTFLIVGSLLLVPVFAYLSDCYGRRNILLFATVGYLIFTLPIFQVMQYTQSWWIFIPLIILYSAEQAVTPIAMVEMFPGIGRYTGLSFAYNITMALVGGTAPLLNTYLINHFNNNLIIAYHLMFCAAVSLVVVLSLPKKYGVQLSLAEVN